jgi:hypothetical protein
MDYQNQVATAALQLSGNARLSSHRYFQGTSPCPFGEELTRLGSRRAIVVK